MSITWNSSFMAIPQGSTAPSTLDTAITDLKEGVFERVTKEHVMDLGSGLPAEDGWHRAGSAIAYVGATAPTKRPDGVTSLNASDKGRLWFDTSVNILKVYDGSATPSDASWLFNNIGVIPTSEPATKVDGQLWLV